MVSAGEAIAKAQAALREAAREHKRLEFAHRRSARRLMQEAESLSAILASYGIRLVISDGTDPAKESEPK